MSQKDERKQVKSIGPVCDPVTTYPLRSFASNGHISLVSTPNREPFLALDFDYLSLKTIFSLPQETHRKKAQF